MRENDYISQRTEGVFHISKDYFIFSNNTSVSYHMLVTYTPNHYENYVVGHLLSQSYFKFDSNNGLTLYDETFNQFCL